MDLSLLKTIVASLTDLIIECNQNLKKGNLNEVITKSNKIFNRYIELYPYLFELIVSDPNYGLNFEFSSNFGKYLFPAFLYKNSFRIQIINELRLKLQKFNSLEEIQLFLSLKLRKTIDVKRNGFKLRTLEMLRFYSIYFYEIRDNTVDKYLPKINDYNSRYTPLTDSILIKNFSLTQKYTSHYMMPNFINLGLNAFMLRYDNNIREILRDLESRPFGFLFNRKKKLELILLFSPYNRSFKSNFIEKICFFENLDLFHKNNQKKTIYNYTDDILNLYYNFKENEFKNTAISVETEFFNKKILSNQILDLDLIIHLFNTRKLPRKHYLHPLSQQFFSYRNKLVNFYSTTSYFIYIFDADNKKIVPQQLEMITTLLKNTFSNGFIIQSKSAFLVSTFLFKHDFEKQKNSFLEFFYILKLEVQIYENLNYTPFSFYHTPNSTYYNTEENFWNFPVYQDKSIEELMNYQVENLQAERNRLQDPVFKERVEYFFDTWSQEVEALNKASN